MTDTELLIYAAKAAGLEHVTPSMVEWGQWNPLTDDGDALRLSAHLGIAIDTAATRVWAFRSWGNPTVMAKEEWFGSAPHCGNKNSATRRAIVRAAAELGQEQT